MKRCLRVVSLLLVISIFLAAPVRAVEAGQNRASAFFASYGAWLEKVTSNSFKVIFTVDSNLVTMDVLGVSEIEIYRSADQSSWTLMRTYNMEDHPYLVDENASTYTYYARYNNATPGYYYCAYVTFYAKNSTGIGERYVYTGILHM